MLVVRLPGRRGCRLLHRHLSKLRILTVSRYPEGGQEIHGKPAEGGDDRAQQCGWLKDRYGASWQVVPRILPHMLTDPDPARTERVMAAMLRMKKIDVDELERAYGG